MQERSSIDLQTFYPESLQIIKIEEIPQQIKITIKSRKHSHQCPECGDTAEIYHAVYMRTVQDLPIFQKNVTLQIKACNYYCTNKDCDVVSFAEDYGGFIGKSDRMTDRLENFIQTLALETNCEGAAVICAKLGIRTSGDTIIRILRKLVDIPAVKCNDTIGVDDFAYRKGLTYCTVICDGKTNQPIDVLDGRDGKSLKEWLKNNKHIKKVTRDRAGTYAKAISEMLPDAMQIADRFHLHQNLSTAVKEALNSVVPNEILIPNKIPEFEDNASTENLIPIVCETVAIEDKKN